MLTLVYETFGNPAADPKPVVVVVMVSMMVTPSDTLAGAWVISIQKDTHDMRTSRELGRNVCTT